MTPLDTHTTLEAIGRIAEQPLAWIAATGWWGSLERDWRALAVIGAAFVFGNLTWAALGERWQAFDEVQVLDERQDTLKAQLDEHRHADIVVRVGELEGTIDELQPVIWRLFCDRFPEDCELGPALRPR